MSKLHWTEFLDEQRNTGTCAVKANIAGRRKCGREGRYVVEAGWNVMAHAQKPDFVFRRNGRVHLNRRGGGSVQSTPGSRGVRISGSNAGYTMFRGSVKSTGYPLHSADSSSLPLPCVTVCHHISTGIYNSARPPNEVRNTRQANVRINVILRRVRVTTVAVENL